MFPPNSSSQLDFMLVVDGGLISESSAYRDCIDLSVFPRQLSISFLPVLDYGDMLYMHAPSTMLKKLDSAYHAAIRFVTGAGSRTHHCTLYQSLGWTSLYKRRESHMLIFTLKSLLGKLPSYISRLLHLPR